jgi:hypothetical protein
MLIVEGLSIIHIQLALSEDVSVCVLELWLQIDLKSDGLVDCSQQRESAHVQLDWDDAASFHEDSLLELRNGDSH